jgi:uncharacterized membrane protein (DUF373 family)
VKGVKLLILRILNGLDLLIYALVGVAFVAAAVLAFAFSITQLLSGLLANLNVVLPFALHFNDIALEILSFVSDLLLVLIIMELLGTIRSYVEKGDTSVTGTPLTPDEFRNAMIELAVNAVVIIALGVTMRILHDLIGPKESRHTQGQQPVSTDSAGAPSQPEPLRQNPQ